MLDYRPPSRTPQDGTIWTNAVFVWYVAVLDGFQPYKTMFGSSIAALTLLCKNPWSASSSLPEIGSQGVARTKGSPSWAPRSASQGHVERQWYAEKGPQVVQRRAGML